MGATRLDIDIAIIGGGIAGLWVLNLLRDRGYSAVLLEHRALGSDQTIGSQGMIHGGVKYALDGTWSEGSQTVSAMPAVWRACLAGTGEVDLRGTRVLSDGYYLWSGSALPARLGAFLAGKLLRGRVQQLAPADYPQALQSPDFGGQVYRLDELVLDVPSLLAVLSTRQRDAIYAIDWQRAALGREGRRAVVDTGDCLLAPRRLLLTAGAGNEALIAGLDSTRPAMQRRPLQQVLVRHQCPLPLFGHCLGGGASPRLSISSHRDQADRPVWSLGGDLATGSAGWPVQRLIERAQHELAAVLPWLDLGQCDWATVRLDRAEPRQGKLRRPEQAFIGRLDGVDNTLAAWPTKLTLCPALGSALCSRLEQDGILPHFPQALDPLAGLARPPPATPYWDTLFT
jgi:glycine/D-amino acid oxidase-like deaminating enzyme